MRTALPNNMDIRSIHTIVYTAVGMKAPEPYGEEKEEELQFENENIYVWEYTRS